LRQIFSAKEFVWLEIAAPLIARRTVREAVRPMTFADFHPIAPLRLTMGLAIGVSLAVIPAKAETPNQCARYGVDYVAVSGSNGCVKIGRHVRVDMPRAPAAAPMGYAALGDGVQRTSHLQPMAPFGIMDLLPR
jgi:hypothetical protein